MKSTFIKTSRGLINLNNVTVIEKVDGQGSMKYGIRFGLMSHGSTISAIYESYATKEDRDGVYEELFNVFGYKL
jgi:hypothetical protein